MTSRIVRRRLPSLVVALAWVLLPGCGGEKNDPTVPISGTVSVGGKPVAKGTIHFHPDKGRPATGFIKDGRFTLTTYVDGDGGIAGQNKVALEVLEEVPTKGGDTNWKSLIPQKFMDPFQSGISIDVPQSGYKNLEIDILKEAVKIKEG
jgi:hypothetical protein